MLDYLLLMHLLLVERAHGWIMDVSSFLQQGADRQLWFASKQSLSYLDGTYVPITIMC
jgi:hypothetical protein